MINVRKKLNVSKLENVVRYTGITILYVQIKNKEIIALTMSNLFAFLPVHKSQWPLVKNSSRSSHW